MYLKSKSIWLCIYIYLSLFFLINCDDDDDGLENEINQSEENLLKDSNIQGRENYYSINNLWTDFMHYFPFNSNMRSYSPYLNNFYLPYSNNYVPIQNPRYNSKPINYPNGPLTTKSNDDFFSDTFSARKKNKKNKKHQNFYNYDIHNYLGYNPNYGYSSPGHYSNPNIRYVNQQPMNYNPHNMPYYPNQLGYPNNPNPYMTEKSKKSSSFEDDLKKLGIDLEEIGLVDEKEDKKKNKKNKKQQVLPNISPAQHPMQTLPYYKSHVENDLSNLGIDMSNLGINEHKLEKQVYGNQYQFPMRANTIQNDIGDNKNQDYNAYSNGNPNTFANNQNSNIYSNNANSNLPLSLSNPNNYQMNSNFKNYDQLNHFNENKINNILQFSPATINDQTLIPTKTENLENNYKTTLNPVFTPKNNPVSLNDNQLNELNTINLLENNLQDLNNLNSNNKIHEYQNLNNFPNNNLNYDFKPIKPTTVTNNQFSEITKPDFLENEFFKDEKTVKNNKEKTIEQSTKKNKKAYNLDTDARKNKYFEPVTENIQNDNYKSKKINYSKSVKNEDKYYEPEHSSNDKKNYSDEEKNYEDKLSADYDDKSKYNEDDKFYEDDVNDSRKTKPEKLIKRPMVENNYSSINDHDSEKESSGRNLKKTEKNSDKYSDERLNDNTEDYRDENENVTSKENYKPNNIEKSSDDTSSSIDDKVEEEYGIDKKYESRLLNHKMIKRSLKSFDTKYKSVIRKNNYKDDNEGIFEDELNKNLKKQLSSFLKNKNKKTKDKFSKRNWTEKRKKIISFSSPEDFFLNSNIEDDFLNLKKVFKKKESLKSNKKSKKNNFKNHNTFEERSSKSNKRCSNRLENVYVKDETDYGNLSKHPLYKYYQRI